VVDHRTRSQKAGATVAGVGMLVGGVILGAVFYGNVAVTVVSALCAVTGLGLLRYAFMRRTRVARG
jgi:hypothetical protein